MNSKNVLLKTYLDHLEINQKTFKRLLPKEKVTPSPEKIHKIRVTIRRIRAGIYLAEHANKKLTFQKLDQSLKKLSKDLSIKRELDVAIQNSKAFQVRLPHQKALLRKVNLKALKALEQKRQKKIVNRLQKSINQIREETHLNLIKSLRKLKNEIKPWLSHTLTTDEDLHQLRLKMKHLRYSLEIISHPQKELIQLQKHLRLRKIQSKY